MSGRRLLDIAALFNASRGVAQKHVALRSHQLDVYTRTSTLAKAVKNQTDRVTETAKAASFLASRLNESAPSWSSDVDTQQANAAAASSNERIPSQKSTKGGNFNGVQEEGIDQDHHYEKSVENSAPVPANDLNIQQEKANRYPLPDGTIPPVDATVNVPNHDRDVVSERSSEPAKDPLANSTSTRKFEFKPAYWADSTIPIPSAVKTPLAADVARKLQQQSGQQITSKFATAPSSKSGGLLDGHDQDVFYEPSTQSSPAPSTLSHSNIPKHTEDTQGTDEHVEDRQINSDSFYSSHGRTASQTVPTNEAVPEQEQIVDGVNTDIFYSPRVARILGGKTHTGPTKDLELKGSEATPIDRTPLAARKDQDTFNVRLSSQKEPSSPDLGSNTTGSAIARSSSVVEESVEELAAKISEETLTASDSLKVSTNCLLEQLSADKLTVILEW
jgi:aarF domain-containing kinase